MVAQNIVIMLAIAYLMILTTDGVSALSLSAYQPGPRCLHYPYDPTVAFWHMGRDIRVSLSLVSYK